MAFNLSDYEEVKDRIPRFLEAHPDGRIITSLDRPSDFNPGDLDTVVFVAYLYANADEQAKHLPLSTGWAFEKAGSTAVNRTSHVENCETSAIGRALANIGIQGKNRASREEMEKVQRHEAEPAKPAEIKPAPDKLRKRFFAVANTYAEAYGKTPDEVKENFKAKLGLESFNDATAHQLEAGIAVMEEAMKGAA